MARVQSALQWRDLAYTFASAALAGVLFSFYMLSGYGLHAQGTELDAIAAVVIGGTCASESSASLASHSSGFSACSI